MVYRFKIHKEETGFWAECTEIPGCSTHGENSEELKNNAADALNLILGTEEPFVKIEISEGKKIKLYLAHKSVAKAITTLMDLIAERNHKSLIGRKV